MFAPAFGCESRGSGWLYAGRELEAVERKGPGQQMAFYSSVAREATTLIGLAGHPLHPYRQDSTQEPAMLNSGMEIHHHQQGTLVCSRSAGRGR